MWDEIARLHKYLGHIPPEISVLKVAEEAGEAAQALIGSNPAWSPRKGAHTTTEDLLDELADVMLSAAVAMARIAGDTTQASAHFERRLKVVMTRAGLARPSAARHWTASAIVLSPQDELLLIDHVKSQSVLFPGGHVEAGESLAEAALREVREETGVVAEILTGPLPSYDPMATHPLPFAIIEGPVIDPVNGPHRHIDAVYVCRASAALTGPVDLREVRGVYWADPDAMDDLAVPPELPVLTRAAITWAAGTAQQEPDR